MNIIRTLNWRKQVWTFDFAILRHSQVRRGGFRGTAALYFEFASARYSGICIKMYHSQQVLCNHILNSFLRSSWMYLQQSNRLTHPLVEAVTPPFPESKQHWLLAGPLNHSWYKGQPGSVTQWFSLQWTKQNYAKLFAKHAGDMSS